VDSGLPASEFFPLMWAVYEQVTQTSASPFIFSGGRASKAFSGGLFGLHFWHTKLQLLKVKI